MGDLTTGFLSLRREGLSRSSLWSPTRSPERAQPWIVAALAGLERWSWDLLLLMLFMLLNSITKGKKSERKEKKKKKKVNDWRERKRKRLFWVVWIFFSAKYSPLSLWRSSILCQSSFLFPFIFLSLFLCLLVNLNFPSLKISNYLPFNIFFKWFIAI